MKETSFLKAIKSITSFLLLLLTVSTVIISCKKDKSHFDTDLSIDRRIIKIADTAASTHVLVYADADWNVDVPQNPGWVKIDRASGNGNGEFVATVQSNVGNLPRAVDIVLTANGKTETINLQQRGLVPTINIADATANGIANGGAMKTSIVTNIPFNLMQHEEVYGATGGTNWLSALAINGTDLTFNLEPNNNTQPRQVVIRLSYLDAMGTTTKDSIVVTQNPKGGYDNAVLKDFAYVKNSLAAGVVNEDIYIEGIIISDKGNPNMGQNANNATNKHVVDKTENAITSYIQSLDGKMGLRIRSKTPGDNIYGRNERVKIWLKGITIKKETNPNRVTLDQVQSINVMSKVASTPATPREIYMKDLVDDDTYTYVKLKDVEISVPSGSFFNINEGYILRTDEYPTNIRDINGNSMYMLTNIDVPYRRDGVQVPQGSGNIAGILVHEDLPRYGGNISKYSIRHITRDDIDLRTNRSDGFSNVLVEWSRFKSENVNGATATKNPLTPDIGTGTLTQSLKAPLDFTANGIYGGVDYNGLTIDATTTKGVVTNGSWGAKGWWDDSKNVGASWDITVSTAGITKPISMQIEAGSDIGGPTNFIAEWSASATGPFTQLGEYTCQDVTNYSNTLLTQVPGYKVVNFQFPQSASGLNNLYIRLRVKNKVTGTTTAATGGTLTATGVTRMGHFSIKYNK